MAKTITITYDGKEYVLEFTRKTVAAMEERGFSTREISEKPMSRLPMLFAGAFMAHHPFVKQSTVDAILGKLKNKDELWGKLGEMYSEPIETLMDEPEEDEGNLTWGASF